MTAHVVALRDHAPKQKAAGTDNAFNFSKTTIRKAIDDAGDTTGVEFRDAGCRGLVLRKQTRDWIFSIKRKINGKVRRATIERWTGTNDIAAVRADAERIMSDMKSGHFIPAKAKAAIAAKVEAETNGKVSLATMTVSDAVDLHAEVNPQIRATTLDSYRYAVVSLTEGKAVRVADVTPQMMREAYARVENAKSVATANLMMRSISALWRTWAAEHPEDEEPTRNPVSVVSGKRKGVMKKAKPRDNALRPTERKNWFNAALGMETTASRALAFLFLTGLRRDEVFHMPWSGVDLDAGTITISADIMKSGIELTRPTTSDLRSILFAQRKAYPHSKFVFPGATGSGPLINGRKALRFINAATLDDGRSIMIHDLRRTYLAAAALAGLPDVATKMLVGHSISDVTMAYQTALRSELPVFAERVEAELLREVLAC